VPERGTGRRSAMAARPWHARGLQPARRWRLQPVRRQPGAARRAALQRARLDTGALRRWAPRLGSAEMQTHARLANTTRRSCAATTASATASTRSSSTPSYHALMAAAARGRPARHAVAPAAAAARTCRARGGFMLFTELRAVGPVPDLDDLCRHAGAARQRRRSTRLGARAHQPRLRPGAPALARQARRDHGHGHDREAGRLRRARQHHAGRARRHDAWGARYRSPATSGSSRRRCATPSWCWRRPPAACRAFFLPRVLPDGSRNALRIQRLKDKLGNKANASSEVEFDGAAPGWWATRGAACRRSWRWAR
jgi:putative acyl-CoA dehydrogenase